MNECGVHTSRCPWLRGMFVILPSTLVACSASSSDCRWASFVRKVENLVNKSSNCSLPSKSLLGKRERESSLDKVD
jgi:hypothetical protein